jgi:hypothetical protein
MSFVAIQAASGNRGDFISIRMDFNIELIGRVQTSDPVTTPFVSTMTVNSITTYGGAGNINNVPIALYPGLWFSLNKFNIGGRVGVEIGELVTASLFSSIFIMTDATHSSYARNEILIASNEIFSTDSLVAADYIFGGVQYGQNTTNNLGIALRGMREHPPEKEESKQPSFAPCSLPISPTLGVEEVVDEAY